MKKAGIIGGMSWESTAKYYQWLNEGIKERLGGLSSAKVVITSVDFSEIEKLQAGNKWDEAGDILATEALNLERAGADFILLATNTMHRVADKIKSAIHIPFVHLADATAEKIKAAKLDNIGLLGTIYTMEQDFYKGRLAEQGLKVSIPDQASRQDVNRIIYEELCLGKINLTSKEAFIKAANTLVDNGAQGVIFGCTEITMLVDQKDLPFPVFDTTRIHIEKALDLMVS